MKTFSQLYEELYEVERRVGDEPEPDHQVLGKEIWDAGLKFKKEIKAYRKLLAKHRMSQDLPDAKKDLDKKVYSWIEKHLKARGIWDKHKSLDLNGQINNFVKINW